MGIVGSDVLGECDQETIDALCIRPLQPISNKAGQSLGFRLLATGLALPRLQNKIRSGVNILIGTSYPNTARRKLGASAIVQVTCSGGAEALPYKYPELDGIFEAVQSGVSARVNYLSEVDYCLTRQRFPEYGGSEQLCYIESIPTTNREML